MVDCGFTANQQINESFPVMGTEGLKRFSDEDLVLFQTNLT